MHEIQWELQCDITAEKNEPNNVNACNLHFCMDCDNIVTKYYSPGSEATQQTTWRKEEKCKPAFAVSFCLILNGVYLCQKYLPSSSHHEVNFNLVGNQDTQHLFFYSLSQPVEDKAQGFEGLERFKLAECTTVRHCGH